MFGRYPLPLWRRVVGAFFAMWFVVGLYAYMASELSP
jgi:hypothetical protein